MRSGPGAARRRLDRFVGRGGPGRSRSSPYLLLVPVLAILAVGLVLPTISLFDASFTETTALGEVTGRSFGGYERALETPLYRDALLTTLALSIPAALLCVALSYPVAYYLAFRASRYRNLLLFLIVISTFASFIVRVYAWRIILGDGGVINDGLLRIGVIEEPLRFLIYSRSAVLITWLSVFLPLTILILTAAMMNIRPELLENARDLGAGAIRTFTRVLLPLTMPGAVGAFVLVLIFAASDFITPDQIGGSIVFLGNFIADQFQVLNGDRQAAAALAFLLMAVFLLIYFALSQLERLKGFTGPPAPERLMHVLDRFARARRHAHGLRLYTALVLVFLVRATRRHDAVRVPQLGGTRASLPRVLAALVRTGCRGPGSARCGGEQPRALAGGRGGRRRCGHDGGTRYHSVSPSAEPRSCGFSSSRRSCCRACSTRSHCSRSTTTRESRFHSGPRHSGTSSSCCRSST